MTADTDTNTTMTDLRRQIAVLEARVDDPERLAALHYARQRVWETEPMGNCEVYCRARDRLARLERLEDEIVFKLNALYDEEEVAR